MLTGLLTLVAGLAAGLARMGWLVDSLSKQWMLLHGPLMICGFLGTLICLERAVALSAWEKPSWLKWSLLVPAVNAGGAFALLLLGDTLLAKSLLVLGSIGLLFLYAVLLHMQVRAYLLIMTLGALCWLVGNVLWLTGEAVFEVVHLWTAFLILTIVGERIELSRVRRLPRAVERALLVALAIYGAGVLLTIVNLDVGSRVLGGGAILVAAWLLRYDIARYTIRKDGVARYIAACLLIGYGWLAIGGLICLWQGALYAGPVYAAMLHAFLLGFVFSMIFGHVPIILPALTGLRLNYHPIFYLPLALLHLTLLVRVYGYLSLHFGAQQAGGLLNVVAVLVFLAMTLWLVVRSNRVQVAQGGRPEVYPTAGRKAIPPM
jgi:hypothetical protein